MEKGVGVRGSAAGMGCVRVRVGSGFSLSFLVSRTTYVFRTFGSGFMCFFLFFCFFNFLLMHTFSGMDMAFIRAPAELYLSCSPVDLRIALPKPDIP